MGDNIEEWLKFETQHVVEEELALADEKVDPQPRPPVHPSQRPRSSYNSHYSWLHGGEMIEFDICLHPDPCPKCGNCLLCDGKCRCYAETWLKDKTHDMLKEQLDRAEQRRKLLEGGE